MESITKSFIPVGFSGLKIIKVKNRTEYLEIGYTTSYEANDPETGAKLVTMDEIKTASQFAHKPHQLCEKAFNNMVLHLLFMFGVLDQDEYDEDVFKEYQDGVLAQTYPKIAKLVENAYVQGYSLGGGKHESGIVLTGGMISPIGMNVTMNTPFVLFVENEPKYIFMEQFLKDYSELEHQVFEYMKGKRFFDGQLDMFEDEGMQATIMAEGGTKLTKKQLKAAATAIFDGPTA